MNAQAPKDSLLSPLFDTSQPYLYAIVLPPLVLFALGQRRASLLYLLGAIGVFAFLRVT